MTTTSNFQVKPDFYMSKEECISSLKNRTQTNKRYKNFYQTHFTAGDEEQFQNYRHDENNHDENNENISLEDNIFSNSKIDLWEGYENLETPVVLNTFRYIFNKFKKGIFVKIVNNKLKVFLPFSNANFTNEWSHKIKIPDSSVFKYISRIDGREYNEKSLNIFKNTWYTNNCLIRHEFPLNEGDTNVSNIKNMLDELCEHRKIPDIEFFINRRDFPILTKNYYEPYYDIWDSEKHPLVSHKFDKYLPILSMSKKEHYADVLIPTHEDWSRVQFKEGKYFVKSSRSCDDDNFTIKWEDKKPIAVFRGSSTGSGVTIDTNQRLKIAYISSLNKIDKTDNLPFIDAGITKWNVRLKKLMNQTELKTIDVDKLNLKLFPTLTYEEICGYKYIIHIDGHVSAFRLSSEFSMNSVLLIVESDWKIWYSDLLKPYEHYVPVKKDLSDIIDQVKWCKNNDDKCKQIVENARKFYDTYLNKKGIFDYMQKVIMSIKEKTGTYYYLDRKLIDIQIERQQSIMKSLKYPETDKTIEDIHNIPEIGRCYGLLKGIHYIIMMIENKLSNYLFKNDLVFKNRNVDIYKTMFMNFNFIIKDTHGNKIKENIHEIFVGVKCINHMIKYIPNFCYTFGMINDSELIYEYIEGQSLYDYIKSDSFSFEIYINILLQICLTLHVAQNMCCFVHYDLSPWNIIIQKLDKQVEIEYVISHDKVIKFKTNIIPIIIDYGKSHVVYDNIHYGYVNVFKFSTSHDIISILIISMYQILVDQNISHKDFSNLMKLSNFITGTKFRKEQFTNLKELKNFLYTSKKYSSLLYSDKYDLENVTPMNLFDYITSKIKYTFDYSVQFTYKSFMNKYNKNQVFEYILSNSEKEKQDSYLNVLKQLDYNDIHYDNNIELVYNTQKTFNIINDILVACGKNVKIKLILKNILNKYKKCYNSVNIVDDIFFKEDLQKYTDDILLITPPENLEKYKDTSKYIKYKHMITMILLNNNKNTVNSSINIKNYENLLKINSSTLINNNANYNTLKEYKK